MRIHFLVRFSSQFGQQLFVSGNHAELGNDDLALAMPLTCLNDEFWEGSVELTGNEPIRYRYLLTNPDGSHTLDWGDDRSVQPGTHDNYVHIDTWNDPALIDNALSTQPFEAVLLKRTGDPQFVKPAKKTTHLFKIKVPLLEPHEVPVLIGSTESLGQWQAQHAVPMKRQGAWWVAEAVVKHDEFPLAYKYATRHHDALIYEDGNNRLLHDTIATNSTLTVLHDGFLRTNRLWKGSGVAIPVFSLRSAQSEGVGDFNDLKRLADWAADCRLKMIQLLPINDTAATGLFTDSYPYAAISAFALHPLYLNLTQVAGTEHADVLADYQAQVAALNELPEVDYVAVMDAKSEATQQLFIRIKNSWGSQQPPADQQRYIDDNKHWLLPYAAFCHYRDVYGTADFNQWPAEAAPNSEQTLALYDPASEAYQHLQIHMFVQYHLHLQLLEATNYAHSKGLVIKGDIAIGIFRHSCDAWVAPHLYYMDQQAGAPPDDFAENGQNWGFPTYNWQQMKADGFAWWRQRFAQLSQYFDAFRIDHILGFFRIWSTPMHAVEATLGKFVPALPVYAHEFTARGIAFDHDRFCKPYITGAVLLELFDNATANQVAHTFLEPNNRNGFDFKPEFATQRQVEAYFAQHLPEQTALRNKLYTLHSNVLLIADDHQANAYHFRINLNKTSAFRLLSAQAQKIIHDLYLDYYYSRQDEAWQREAMEKLPALKRSTGLLLCGEDLGMVPDCVPHVMQQLGLLSLEIQRMPKATGIRFFHPKDAPYLSVVTPGTHDMSTIRGWWEEDRVAMQQFYNDILGRSGQMPYFCEPWVNEAIIGQHMYSPAMWAVCQLQDWLGIDGLLRRNNPHDERINQPANVRHYWRYRMHMPLEQLCTATAFNNRIATLVSSSGRG